MGSDVSNIHMVGKNMSGTDSEPTEKRPEVRITSRMKRKKIKVKSKIKEAKLSMPPLPLMDKYTDDSNIISPGTSIYNTAYLGRDNQ